MSRNNKIRALQSALSGHVSGLNQYWQASRPPFLLMIQKEPDNGYSIKPDATRPELPTGTLTEPEYNKVLENLRRRHEPVICMIRPLKKPRTKSEV
jgi:hypothetical protein